MEEQTAREGAMERDTERKKMHVCVRKKARERGLQMHGQGEKKGGKEGWGEVIGTERMKQAVARE